MASGDFKKKLLRAVFGAAVFLVTLAVFSGALNNDFVNWDDDKYIYENPVIQSSESDYVWNIIAGMHQFNYWHPAAWLSHALDYQIYKLDPSGYHLSSIIFHAMTAAAVYFLFVTLIGAVRPECRMSWNLIIAAAFAALVYGLHPLRVEPAVWIAERKEVMSGFFYFAGLLAYIHYVFANSTRRRILFYSGTFIMFCLGLLSKPHVVTFPAVLLLLDWYPFKRLGDSGKRWPVFLEKIPFFALSLAFSAATMILQKGGGAVKSLEEVTLGPRLWNAIRSLSFYVEKTLWPFPLIPYYPLEESPSVVSAPFILSAVLILGISYFCVKLWRRKNPLYLAAWIYYLITIFPAIGIVQVGGQAAGDRFSYSTTLSFYFLLGLGMLWILEKKRGSLFRIPFRPGIAACGIILLALLSFLTHRQIGVWKNGETLWTYVLKHFPERVPFAHYNLGNMMREKGNNEEAIVHYNTALRLMPNHASTHNNLGLALVEENKIDEAIVHYDEAIRLDSDPAEAHSNLGVALALAGKPEEAIAHYEEAIGLKPGLAKAYYNLGLIQGKQRNVDEAILNLNEAIRLLPSYAEAHSDLGIALALAGKPEEAIAHYREAIKLRPNFAKAYFNFGNTLAQQGNFQEAIVNFELAIKIAPGFARAHYTLGRVLSLAGKPEEAANHFNAANEPTIN